MFQGTIPDGIRRIIHEHAAGWPKGCDVYVGCSGNLTIERTLAPLGFRLHSNDVNPYSCALGWYFSGQRVPYALKEKSRAELGWLEPSLDNGVGTLATVMLGTNFLGSVGRSNLYHQRQVQAYRDQWDTVHAKTVERLLGASLHLDSFDAADVVTWVDEIPDEAPVAMFPPFWAKGYETMFAGIDNHFDWPEPEYEILTDASKDHLLASIMGRRYWLIGLHYRVEELEDCLRGYVKPTNRSMPIFLYGSTPGARIQVPRQNIEPVKMPTIGPADDLGRHVKLHVLTGPQFAGLRSHYLSKSILPGEPLLACAVSVDGQLIGAFAFLPPSFDPGTAYLMSDFPVGYSKYKRLSKLIVMAATSQEAQILMQRALSRRMTNVATTAFSDNPNSAKYGRGVPGMRLTKRTEPAPDGVHAYQLQYEIPFGQWNLGEALRLWRQKHGGAR